MAGIGKDGMRSPRRLWRTAMATGGEEEKKRPDVSFFLAIPMARCVRVCVWREGEKK